MSYIDLKKENFVPVHVSVENAEQNGETVLRVAKAEEKLWNFDENTYAKLNDVKFHNGTVEVKMFSRLLPDAPDFARGFIGIAYRIKDNDSEFESFYVRPTNGRDCTDPVRRSHGCQYFSYPGYTFAYFREFGIADYENTVDIALGEWIDLKAVIEDDHAEFFVNGVSTLTVNNMKHGVGEAGNFGFFVDIGTEAFFKDLVITPND
jgi:hypothetical protein